MQVQSLTIYTSVGCHLCEKALAMLQPLQKKGIIGLTEVNIADDDELVEIYGLRIPVLRREDNGAELDWPFGLEEVDRFITACLERQK